MRNRSNERERRVKEKERMKERKGGRKEERKYVHMCVCVRAWGWKPTAYAC
jgi:hypothetical protein